MSGWTIATLRPKKCREYKYTDREDGSKAPATDDCIVTLQNDERVRDIEKNDEVYVYLDMERYAFEKALSFLNDYSEMVERAVVLGANDTTDTGESRYAERYENGDFYYVDEYVEEPPEHWVGEKALSYMWAEYDIAARDPWHNNGSTLAYYGGENGVNRL